MDQTRLPAVAGQFYPNDPQELSQMIDEFLNQVDEQALKNVNPNKIKALIVPHAGYPFSGPVAAYAYKLLTKLPQNTAYQIILLGISHFIPIIQASTDSHFIWQTPLSEVKLIQQNTFPINLKCHAQEHSLEVQIPFLQKTLQNFQILPLLTNQDDPDQLAQNIYSLFKKNTILIVSSDLSHYLPYHQANLVDEKTCQTILNLDINSLAQSGESACGINGILTLLTLAQTFNWQAQLLKYANSGDTRGDQSQVVGYAAFAFCQ